MRHYSYEEVIDYVGFFITRIKEANLLFPDWIQNRIEYLSKNFLEYKKLYHEFENVKTDLQRTIHDKKKWFKNSKKELKMTYFLVASYGKKDITSLYFMKYTPSRVNSLPIAMEILDHIISVSDSTIRTEVDPKLPILRELYNDGKILLSVDFKEKSENRGYTKEMQILKKEVMKIYEVLWYLIQGYFIEQFGDITLYFKEEQKKQKRGRKPKKTLEDSSEKI